MSCLQNDKTYEYLLEKFHILIQEDRELEDEVKMNLFTDRELWLEKELGDEGIDAIDRIFHYLWKYDAEGLYHNIPKCVAAYIKSLNGKRSCE